MLWAGEGQELCGQGHLTEGKKMFAIPLRSSVSLPVKGDQRTLLGTEYLLTRVTGLWENTLEKINGPSASD